MNYFGVDINMSVGEDIHLALRSGRFPHSIVLEGATPEKRLKLANGIAGALVCSSTEKPCGSCSHCRKAAGGIHPDILTYREDEKGNFRAETARSVVNSVGIIPNEADAKVYILVMTGPMNPIAQNILLKSLEEPPKYAFFIIACPSKTDLLDTVLSRSRVFSLGEQEVQLSEADEEAAYKAACSIAKAIVAPGEFEIVAAAGVFEKKKDLFANTLPLLETIFVEAMKTRCAGTDGSSFEGTPKLLASRLTIERISTLQKHVRTLENALANNRNYNLTITRLCTLFREQN